MASVALWSFAVFMASVFAGLLTGITLTPKYKGSIRALFWILGAVAGYLLAFFSYSINLYNDAVGILGLSALVCLVFSTQGRRIFSLFFQEEAVLAEGVTLMRLAAAVVFLQISQVVFSGCLRGAGDVRYMALVSLSSATIARPVLGWLFCYGFGLGLTGAWIGLTLDQALRLLLSGARFVSGKWTRIKI